MHFLDLQVDFFRPVWKRVAVVLVCIGWSIFEFASGTPFWGIIFGGIGVYALWQLFFDGWPAETTIVNPGANKKDSSTDDSN